MNHGERLFLKLEGMKLAASRVLRRLKCAAVSTLCVTTDVVNPAISAIINFKHWSSWLFKLAHLKMAETTGTEYTNSKLDHAFQMSQYYGVNEPWM